MNLKVKGKFFEETEAFISDIGDMPPKKLKSKMLRGLSY
jgi:hypothetical protein